MKNSSESLLEQGLANYGLIPGSGRRAERLAALFRREILSGKLAGGAYMPPIREICKEHGAAMETVCRALKALTQERLVRSEPRKGYRVLARANQPDRGCPLALVLESSDAHPRGGIEKNLLHSFQNAAIRRDRSLLAIGTNGRSATEITDRLLAAHAWGVVLNTNDPALIGAVKQAGLCLALAETWSPESELDTVVQDSFRGAFAAATYLIERGHRRIGWIGRGATDSSLKAVERYAGAAAALARAGLVISREDSVYFDDSHAASFHENIRKMMSRPDGPTGLLALWKPRSETALAAAGEANRIAGRDFELVGWSVAEKDDGLYPLPGKQGCGQPRMVWSMERMAEIVLDRLEARRRVPDLQAVTIEIPVRLRRGEANSWDGVSREQD